MEFEYFIWNITGVWKPLPRATTLAEAKRRIKEMGPYAEELKLRDATTKKEINLGRNV